MIATLTVYFLALCTGVSLALIGVPVLFNLINKKRRSRNIGAYRVLMGTRFPTKGPGKGRKHADKQG